MDAEKISTKDLYEIAYEKAEEELKEQRFLCQQITSAIETLEDQLEPTNERDAVISQLTGRLYDVQDYCLRCEAKYSAAEEALSQYEDAKRTVNG